VNRVNGNKQSPPILEPEPKSCNICGQLYPIRGRGHYGADDDCPFCSRQHSLTLQPSDPRYVLFLSMVERCVASIEPSDLIKIEPTRRELEVLEHGDQIVHNATIWRIHSKSYGAEGSDAQLTIFGQPTARSAPRGPTEENAFFVSSLPPMVPSHALGMLTREQINSFGYIPISLSRDRSELVLVGVGDNTAREWLRALIPGINLCFWSTAYHVFAEAVETYLCNEHPSGCQPESAHYQCPRRWNELEPTDSIDVRFCEGCAKKVHWVKNAASIQRHLAAGHCIAMSRDYQEVWQQGPRSPGVWMGAPGGSDFWDIERDSQD